MSELGVESISLGILASHGGTNLQAIIDACETGSIDAHVAVVVSNNSKSYSLQRARSSGIPAFHLSSQTHSKKRDLDLAIAGILKKYKVDLIILAGYMKRIGPIVLKAFHNRVINSHPALLPKYGGKGMYGMRVHEAIITNKEKESGITIHFVNEHYDEGEHIFQAKTIIETHDSPESLASKINELEHHHFPLVIEKLLQKDS